MIEAFISYFPFFLCYDYLMRCCRNKIFLAVRATNSINSDYHDRGDLPACSLIHFFSTFQDSKTVVSS